jgi:hypothetical protein
LIFFVDIQDKHGMLYFKIKDTLGIVLILATDRKLAFCSKNLLDNANDGRIKQGLLASSHTQEDEGGE